MEAYLPSPLEQTVAKALLLLSNLSCKPPTKSSSFRSSYREELPSSSSASDSSSSVLTTGDSCKKTRPNQLQLLAMAACYRKKKKATLKIAPSDSKKCYQVSRYRSIFSLGQKKAMFPASSTLATEGSSLTSKNSSAAASLRWMKQGGRIASLSESTRLRLRAEAILKFLAQGCAPEFKIRQAIGNSPDTSKALRMLLRLEEIKRSGAGGRTDPFLYAVAAGPPSEVFSI